MYKFSISRNIASPLFLSLLVSSPFLGLTISSEAQAQDGKTAPKPAAASPEKTTAAPAPAVSDSEATVAVPAGPTEEQVEAARVSFEAGTKAFEEGSFDLAVTEFGKAHSTFPSPHAEYWLAASMDKADAENKNPAAVVAAYEKFLSNSGKSHVGEEFVKAAETRVPELKKLLPSKIKFVTTPAGAVVTIDGTARAGVTPLDVELPSGTHKVDIKLDGYEPTSIELNAEGGTEVEQQVTLTALAAAPVAPLPVEEAPAVSNSIVPAVVTLSIAGAGLITGTVFGIMALNSKSKFNDNPNTDDADAAERNALIADMSFGIAITLGVTGVVLLTANDKDETQAKLMREPRFVVAPYGSPYGGGAAAQLKF